jgi:hypothetical protein
VRTASIFRQYTPLKRILLQRDYTPCIPEGCHFHTRRRENLKYQLQCISSSYHETRSLKDLIYILHRIYVWNSLSLTRLLQQTYFLTAPDCYILYDVIFKFKYTYFLTFTLPLNIFSIYSYVSSVVNNSHSSFSITYYRTLSWSSFHTVTTYFLQHKEKIKFGLCQWAVLLGPNTNLLQKATHTFNIRNICPCISL